jgi:hypothetical protein
MEPLRRPEALPLFGFHVEITEMSKTVIYDDKGKPHAVEAVDAREMVRPGADGTLSIYKHAPPDGKAVTLADVETPPGAPQYPPTPQPEHPMPNEHQITQESVRLRQEAHAKGEVPPPYGYDKDGKLIPGTKVGPDGKPVQPPVLAGPVAPLLKSPQLAGTVQPAPVAAVPPAK